MWKGGALVHIYTDGSVLLAHGGVEMGQGLHTKMVQVITCLDLSLVSSSESQTTCLRPAPIRAAA